MTLRSLHPPQQVSHRSVLQIETWRPRLAPSKHAGVTPHLTESRTDCQSTRPQQRVAPDCSGLARLLRTKRRGASLPRRPACLACLPQVRGRRRGRERRGKARISEYAKRIKRSTGQRLVRRSDNAALCKPHSTPNVSSCFSHRNATVGCARE